MNILRIIKRIVATTSIVLLLLTSSTLAAQKPILASYQMDKTSLKEVLGVIMAESHNTYESKLATANVILNQKAMYPLLTMSETLRISKQWETVTNGRFKEVEPDKDSVLALVDAMNGVTNVDKAVYFYNPNLCQSDWHETQIYVATIGDQRYFERKAR